MHTITAEINISKLQEDFPEVIDVLILEYGFHCIGCFVSEFETLIEGAQVHGIVGEDFDLMLKHLNSLVQKNELNSSTAV